MEPSCPRTRSQSRPIFKGPSADRIWQSVARTPALVATLCRTAPATQRNDAVRIAELCGPHHRGRRRSCSSRPSGSAPLGAALDPQRNYTVRMIASVGVVAPAVSKDQRRLAQQLMRLHVSFPDLCNELSESINELSESIRGTVSDVSACVTDSSKAGFCRGCSNICSD